MPEDRISSKSSGSLALSLGVSVLLAMLGEGDLSAQVNAAATSGCARRDVRTGALTLITTDGNHVSRTYLLQVPASYTSQRRYPVIFVFHGHNGSATQSRSWGLQGAQGASENAIFAYPQGIEFNHGGVGWDDSTSGYDMTFFDNMLEDVESSYCVNEREVFVAGFSWGGDFATALACNRGDKIRAVAANSTNDEYSDKSNYKTYRWLPCASGVHPAIRFEHAIEGDSAYPAPMFATTAKLFQSFNECRGESKPAPSSTATEACVAYTGCKEELIECSFEKSIGHRLPPNWAQDTWDFFRSFQKP